MTLSRRAFLQATLGAVAASQACRFRPSDPRYSGQLLGQSADVGHLIREGVERPVTKRTKLPVVIVGAGPAGLSAGWRLARAGEERFAIVDLEPQAGGTSASTSKHPWGAHYVPVPSVENRSLLRLLRELGAIESVSDDGHVIGAEDVLCRSPHERLFYRGHWHEGLYLRANALPRDLLQLQHFEAEVQAWAAKRDAAGRPFFAVPSSRCSMEEEALALDRISMRQFLDAKGWDSPRLRWWVDYACRDDYGLRLEETSAWAGLFYFAARMENPDHEPAAFLTWPEGNGRIVNHLARSCGDRLRTGVLVVGLEEKESHVEVRLLNVATREVEIIEADRVVAAVAPFILKRLLPASRQVMPDEAWGSWIVANLSLRDRPVPNGFPLAWDNVLYDSESLGYVVSTHQDGIDYGPTDFTWYLPLTNGAPKPVREELLNAPWQRWADTAMADLTRAHPDLPKLVESIDVWRWGHAMPRPVPGFLYEGRRRDLSNAIGRVHPAHCGLSGIALLEESHQHGVRAAEEVLRALAVPFETFL